jgi:hypothetical protein
MQACTLSYIDANVAVIQKYYSKLEIWGRLVHWHKLDTGFHESRSGHFVNGETRMLAHVIINTVYYAFFFTILGLNSYHIINNLSNFIRVIYFY